MSYVDSPICRCELMRAMVLTDQTQQQCAVEHECPPGTVCPLRNCFPESQESVTGQVTVAAVTVSPPGRSVRNTDK